MPGYRRSNRGVNVREVGKGVCFLPLKNREGGAEGERGCGVLLTSMVKARTDEQFLVGDPDLSVFHGTPLYFLGSCHPGGAVRCTSSSTVFLGHGPILRRRRHSAQHLIPADTGCTVLNIDHDMSEVRRRCSRGGRGAGGTQCVHGRIRMTMDAHIPTIPGRRTSGFDQPRRHCLHHARSAVRCSARRVKGELHPSKNRS